LKKIAEKLELSIFFSTHSIDLLREIKAQNMYYISSFWDNSIMVTNPCYPAYATRNLYGDDGYGNDMVILVEDDLAKLIIERLILEKRLVNNIRIKVLPTGGWTNTIIMAYDVTTSNLLQKGTKLAVVLDRDIEKEVPKFISKNKQYSGIKMEMDYLPIASLEKYLHFKLIDSKDKKLFNILDTYLFQKKPLSEILKQYVKETKDNDNDGKALYGLLMNEVKSMRKDREELVDIIVKYIIDNEEEYVDELSKYIINKANM